MNTTPRVVPIPDWSLPSVLARAANNYPAREAFYFMGASTTYGELATTVDRAASALRTLGVEPGDRVGIALPNSPSHVAAFWAILRLGAIVVELNPLLSAEETAALVADSGAKVVLAWSKTASDIAEQTETSVGAACRVIPVNLGLDLPLAKQMLMQLPVSAAKEKKAALIGSPPKTTHWHALVRAASKAHVDLPDALPEPNDLAVLIYTGGTTGAPKGVMLTHRNIAVNAVQGAAWTGHTEEVHETFVGVLPYFHAFGMQLCLTYATHVAASVVIHPKFDVDTFLATQKRRPGTFLPAVPPMLSRLTAAAVERGADLSSFTKSISGSMALPRATADAWEQLTGGLVIEGYGMTETSPVALGSPFDATRRPGTLGKPFPSTEVRVVDPEDPTTEVGLGERGELLIAGPQVFQGYWRKPAETAAALIDGKWLRTGDIVTRDEDGFVTLVDRSKEVIVTGGFKVYPSQVEASLRNMPQISDVAVVGVPAGDLGEKVVAAVVLAEGHVNLDLATLRDWAASHLAKYALPRTLVVVTELPRSAIGKVLRRAVRESLIAVPA